ncbi:hypothetical protein ACHAWU_002479 [Discostella pseudostelligera]|uniref:Uncharacterized protein n=1 Tax=Discostella pseudostelligera TaxID=259834 RepID=A0ABD3LYV2_9STRA
MMRCASRRFRSSGSKSSRLIGFFFRRFDFGLVSSTLAAWPLLRVDFSSPTLALDGLLALSEGVLMTGAGEGIFFDLLNLILLTLQVSQR